ncbi:MAG: outer membrane protein assembly factor BamE [Thermodesulfobacteriota bacterium]
MLDLYIMRKTIFTKLNFLLLLAFSLYVFSTACFSLSDQQGVDNLWREESKVENIEEGKTTQNEVIKLFGPPSQIIDLDSGSVFYYLLQEKKGKGMFLLLFNFKNEKVSYDRAIFFFDSEGILTDYGFSVENIERK